MTVDQMRNEKIGETVNDINEKKLIYFSFLVCVHFRDDGLNSTEG